MSIKEVAHFDLDDELNATRILLERLPDGRFDWRPHEKSWTLGELATHVATLPWWMITTLDEDGFDMGGGTESPEVRSNTESILELFDANAKQLRASFAAATDETMNKPWQFRNGETVIMEQPKSVVLRRFGMSHMIHHRAQLTVYLRQLDVPLPPLYGPTADEQQ